MAVVCIYQLLLDLGTSWPPVCLLGLAHARYHCCRNQGSPLYACLRSPVRTQRLKPFQSRTSRPSVSPSSHKQQPVVLWQQCSHSTQLTRCTAAIPSDYAHPQAGSLQGLPAWLPHPKSNKHTPARRRAAPRDKEKPQYPGDDQGHCLTVNLTKATFTSVQGPAPLLD